MAARQQFLNASACLLVIVAGGAWLSERREPPLYNPASETSSSTAAAADRIDTAIESQWSSDIRPAPVADDLQIARRLALTLHGRIPALDEIRWFESRPAATRLDDWVERLLNDRCFSDYFAERFARALVHSKGSDFPFPFRRDCFTNWLTEQFAENRPYDELARDIITAQGLWTNEPETNFFTAHEADPIRLTTRTTRVFLGLRLDCAQCHNHPFADWKQQDFHGLAAFYSGTKLAPFTCGIHDGQEPYTFALAGKETREGISPQVPFAPELLPAAGSSRDRLAGWVTHRENPYFARALANRIWALMFGVGLVEPIDDLGDQKQLAVVLDTVAAEFKHTGFDLRQLIRIISRTEAFRRESAFHGDYAEESEAVLATYPSTRLRSEQIARAMLQTVSFKQNDYATSGHFRHDEWRLIEELGDKYEEEMEPREANLTQRLMIMNTRSLWFPVEITWGGIAGELGVLSGSPESCVEAAFLVCLTRRPTAEELQLGTTRLVDTSIPQRMARMQDLFWALINGAEFSWLH
jgi:hypothetical protein